MKRLFALLVVLAATAVVAVPLALAGADNGNSVNAKACQKGGWQTLARTQDNTSGFHNQDECVSYAAHGGTLVSLVAKPAPSTAASEPMFNYDVNTCSVTVPYTPGLNTFLYGVPGHPETEAITSDVTVTPETAGQFWIGYTAQPGYVITNPGAGQWHIDFYNGDDVLDCTA